MGRLALEYLKVIGYEPAAVFERDQKVDIGLPVAVCVVTSPYVPIEQDLLKRGFKTVVPFYDVTENFRHLHPLSNGWFAPRFSVNEVARINSILEHWSDDISRAHHLQFLAWRRVREEWVFEDSPISYYPRYFIPEITGVLHDHEVFVDGGAHHGRVSLAFIQQVKGKFNCILAIEPDKANRATYAETLDGKAVELYSCALAEFSGITNFHGGLGYASQLSPTGHEYTITYPIDALKLQPTFLKLHLEGGELAALKGAARTITEYRPIIAVTVYHNEDGIWQTPLWLMMHCHDYKFLFRLHSWCGTGAVIYAIPNERLR